MHAVRTWVRRLAALLAAATLVGGLAAAQPLAGAAAPPVGARPDSAAFMAVRAAGPGYGLVPGEAVLHGQVREPLFAFAFLQTERDRLGVWTAADLLAFAERWGETSDFPLADRLESFTREALPDSEVLRVHGAVCDRRWVIRLDPARLDMPVPYSILGYHPGTLSLQSPIELREWRLGERTVHVTVDGKTRMYAVRGLTVYQVVAGWLILDVDGWLDTLLGKAADDAASEGVAVGWVDEELIGVGNSTGRDGRRIFGELNFRTGEVENHGRPVARGISQHARSWTRTAGVDPRAVWQAYGR